MTRLYEKNETGFAILWIVLYVVLSSVADNLSVSIGLAKSLTAALHIVMSVLLFLWIRKNGLCGKYGFCKSRVPAARFLYYLPLALIASAQLWGGIALCYGAAETVFYVLSMCCVGFLEEVIFRGFLFRAMEKSDLRSAVIVSSLTFGIGHIVNLVNGNSQSLIGTLSQIVFAIMVGFVLVLVFYHGASLIPCIVFHAVNNSLGAFGAESALSPAAQVIVNLALSIFVLGGYALYLFKRFPMGAKKEP